MSDDKGLCKWFYALLISLSFALKDIGKNYANAYMLSYIKDSCLGE